MHPALIKAKAAEADKARQERLKQANQEADRRRAEEAVEHLIEILDDAFGGVLVRMAHDGWKEGRLYASSYTGCWPTVVNLRVRIGSDPRRHPGTTGGITPQVNSSGAVEYRHRCDNIGSGGKIHNNLDVLLACVAKDIAKITVDDPDPPTKVALTMTERARLAALLREHAADDAARTLAARLDPPPPPGARAGRAVEIGEEA